VLEHALREADAREAALKRAVTEGQWLEEQTRRLLAASRDEQIAMRVRNLTRTYKHTHIHTPYTVLHSACIVAHVSCMRFNKPRKAKCMPECMVQVCALGDLWIEGTTRAVHACVYTCICVRRNLLFSRSTGSRLWRRYVSPTQGKLHASRLQTKRASDYHRVMYAYCIEPWTTSPFKLVRACNNMVDSSFR
jgi:hypothetical protein